MRLYSVALAALTLHSGSILAQGVSIPPGSLTGHLYCTDSRTPCRFASVILQTAPPIKDGKPVVSQSPAHSYSTATDLEGAYRITGIVPGDYYILGKLQGYLSAYDLLVAISSADSPLSAQAMESALNRVTIEQGRTTVSNLSIARGATVEGTVHYDDGAVAINLPVHLFRKDPSGAWKPYFNTSGGFFLSPLGLEQHTDDRGHFYEPGLPPGTYTLEATLPLMIFSPQSITGSQSLNSTFAGGNAMRVYFGDKSRLSEAAELELAIGEQRSDIDIRLPTHGLHSIQGTVTLDADPNSVPKGTVSLLDPKDKASMRQTRIEDDGSFAFNYVASGTYMVVIEPSAGKASKSFASTTEMLLVETDIHDLRYHVISPKQ